ncbi:type I toxin-antitoxin system SymE family toxin [Serratia fonticola]|nr:type I toxin-antitoxin system SymE family toxin [Serratia fonticola]
MVKKIQTGGCTGPIIGADWIRDNDELYLARDWLTQCGLTGQPLAISVMPGQVIIQVQQGNIIAW